MNGNKLNKFNTKIVEFISTMSSLGWELEQFSVKGYLYEMKFKGETGDDLVPLDNTYHGVQADHECGLKHVERWIEQAESPRDYWQIPTQSE